MEPTNSSRDEDARMSISINGTDIQVPDDPLISLLDLLRDRLHLHGTKKGCNQGACGACTVLVDGERILSCLSLAVQFDGRSITTIEGLGEPGALHPLQQALVEHDGFQCGYCTPARSVPPSRWSKKSVAAFRAKSPSI